MTDQVTIDLSERSEYFNIQESEFALKREVTTIVMKTFVMSNVAILALIIIGMAVDFAYALHGYDNHQEIITGSVLITFVGSVTSQIAAFSLSIRNFLFGSESSSTHPTQAASPESAPTLANPAPSAG